MKIDAFLGPYEYLSNDHRVNVDLDGDTYPSVTHAYWAAQTMDPHKRGRVRSAASAIMAEALGMAMRRSRKAARDMDLMTMGMAESTATDDTRITTMRELLLDKFSYPDLGKRLLATGQVELVNGQWQDTDENRFWGVVKDRGENHLGRLLMTIRRMLRD